VLIKLAREKDTRSCVLMLGEILNTPGLADRLFEALNPEAAALSTAAPATRRLSRGRPARAEASATTTTPRRRI
jgi:hypothetical protein